MSRTSTPAATPGTRITVPNVATGSTATVQSQPGAKLAFEFDITTASFSRKGNHLVVTPEDGGSITLENFFVVKESGMSLPDFVLPDGVEVLSAAYLAAEHPDLSLETAMGPAAPSTPPSGGTTYDGIPDVDLLGGVDRLDGLAHRDSWDNSTVRDFSIQTMDLLPEALDSPVFSFEGTDDERAFFEGYLPSGTQYTDGSQLVKVVNLQGYSINPIDWTANADGTFTLTYTEAGGAGHFTWDPVAGLLTFTLDTPFQHLGADGQPTDLWVSAPVALTVFDPEGKPVIGSIVIEVRDDAPDFDLSSTGQPVVGGGEVVIGLLNDLRFGADGKQNLLINDGIASFDELTGEYSYQDQHGTYRIAADGTIYFKPVTNENNEFTLKVSAIDGDGDIVSKGFDVIVDKKGMDVEIGGGTGGPRVNEAGLTGGTSAGDGSTDTGWMALTGLPDGAIIDPGIYKGNWGQVIIQLNSSTQQYEYRYVLSAPVNSNADVNGVYEDIEQVVIPIRDAEGNSGKLTVRIDIVDDAPIVETTSIGVVKGTAYTEVGSVKVLYGADGKGSLNINVNGNELVYDPVTGEYSYKDDKGNLYVIGWPENGYSKVYFKAATGADGKVLEPGETVIKIVAVDGDGDEVSGSITFQVERNDLDMEIGKGAGGPLADEAGLASGSAAGSGSHMTGWMAIDLPAGVTPDKLGTITGKYGELEIRYNKATHKYEYQYTLKEAITGADADNGRNVLEDVESFDFVIKDGAGNTGTATVHVDVRDDAPLVNLPNSSVTLEGREEKQVGTVDITFGADGERGVQINGRWAVRGADGSYRADDAEGFYRIDSQGNVYFQSKSNTDKNVTIEISATDGDGDRTVSSGKVQVQVKHSPVDVDVECLVVVDESALADGTGLGGGATATGWIDLTLPNGITSFAVGEYKGKYGTLTVKFEGGKYQYQYILQSAITDEFADDGRNIVENAEQIGIPITGPAGNGTATVWVDVRDDAPIISFQGNGSPVSGLQETLVGQVNFKFGADAKGIILINGKAAALDQGNYVVEDSNGVYRLTTNGSLYFRPKANANKSVDVEVTVVDGDGDKASTGAFTITTEQGSNIDLEIDSGKDGVYADEAGLESGTNPLGSGAKLPWLVLELPDGVFPVEMKEYTGQYGNILIRLNPDTNQYEYQYTLTKAVNDGLGDNIASIVKGADSIVIPIKDAEGNEGKATIKVDIKDDVPLLQLNGPGIDDDNLTLTFDGTSSGKFHLLKGADQVQNDTFTVNGTAITADGTVIVGAYGVLVVNRDGSYTYKANSSSTGQESFRFAYTDADGDSPYVDLNVTIRDMNFSVKDADAKVYEAGLANGTTPGSSTQPAETNKLDLNLPGDVIIVPDSQTGQYRYDGQFGYVLVSYDAASGKYQYQYVLAGPIKDNTLETNGVYEDVESIRIPVKDGFDNTGYITIKVDVVDDEPIITPYPQAGDVDGMAETLVGTLDIKFGADGMGSLLINGKAAVHDPVEDTYTVVDDKGRYLIGRPDENGRCKVYYRAQTDSLGNLPNQYSVKVSITDGDGDEAHATLTGTVNTNANDLEIGKGAGGPLVKESGLADGSDPTSGGHDSGWLAGLPSNVKLNYLGEIKGTWGTLETRFDSVSGTYQYRYTLAKAITNIYANDGPNIYMDMDDFRIEFTNLTTGQKGTLTIYIDIEDDIPVIETSDSNTTIIGQVEAAVGTLDTLKFGADGPGKILINGVEATLANGAYRAEDAQGYYRIGADNKIYFQAKNNQDQNIVIRVVAEDGDGDQVAASTDITVKIEKADDTLEIGKGSGGLAVDESALANGTGGGGGVAETPATKIDLPAGVSELTVGTYQGTYGTLVVWQEGSEYKYKYTLERPVTKTPGANDGRNILEDVEQIRVPMTNGNVYGEVIVYIDIKDDIPVIESTSYVGTSVTGTLEVAVGTIDIKFGADGESQLLINGAKAVLTNGVYRAEDAQGYYRIGDDKQIYFKSKVNETKAVTITVRAEDGDGDIAEAQFNVQVNKGATEIEIGRGAGGAFVDESALPDGTGKGGGSRQTEWIDIELPDGVTGFTQGTYQGQYGTLVVRLANGVYQYQYTLNRAVTPENGVDDGRNTLEDVEHISVPMQTTSGPGAATIYVDVKDDAPAPVLQGTGNVANGLQETHIGNIAMNAGADGLGKLLINGILAVKNSQGDYVVTDQSGSYRITNGAVYFKAASNAAGSVLTKITVVDGDGDSTSVQMNVTVSEGKLDIEIGAGPGGPQVDEAGLPDVGSATLQGVTNEVKGILELPEGITPEIKSYYGKYGTLLLSKNAEGKFEYNYILKKPVTDPSLAEVNGVVIDADTIVIAIRDAHGNTGTAKLYIDIKDDVPIGELNGPGAADDSAIIGAGGSTTGKYNLVKGADQSTTGPDPFKVNGTAVDQDNMRFEGLYGTLVVNQDGTYTYTAKSNVRGQDAFEFSYTDGDGDTTSSTLRVDVSQGAGSGDVTLTVDESGLSDAQTPTAPLTATHPNVVVIDNVEWFFTANQNIEVKDPMGTTLGYLVTDATGNMSFTLVAAAMHAPNTGPNQVLTVQLEVSVYDKNNFESKIIVNVNVHDDAPSLVVEDNVTEVVDASTAPVEIGKITKFSFGADDGAGKALLINGAEATFDAQTNSWTWSDALGTVTIDKDNKVWYQAKDKHKVQDIALKMVLLDADGDESAAGNDITFTYRPETGTGTAPDITITADESLLPGAGTAGNTNDNVVSSGLKSVVDTHGTTWHFVKQDYKVYDPDDNQRQIGTVTFNAQGELVFVLNKAIAHALQGADSRGPITVEVNVYDDGVESQGTGTIKVNLNIVDDVPVLDISDIVDKVVGADPVHIGNVSQFTFGADNEGVLKAFLINGKEASYDDATDTWTCAVTSGDQNQYSGKVIVKLGNGEQKVYYKADALHPTHDMTLTFTLRDADEDYSSDMKIDFTYKPEDNGPNVFEGKVALEANEAKLTGGTAPETGNTHVVEYGQFVVDDKHGTKWYFKEQKHEVFDPYGSGVRIGWLEADSTGTLRFTLEKTITHPGDGPDVSDTIPIVVDVTDKGLHSEGTGTVVVHLTVKDDVPQLSVKSNTGGTVTGTTPKEIGQLEMTFGADNVGGKKALLVNGDEATFDEGTNTWTWIKGVQKVTIDHQGKVVFQATDTLNAQAIKLKIQLVDADGDKTPELNNEFTFSYDPDGVPEADVIFRAKESGLSGGSDGTDGTNNSDAFLTWHLEDHIIDSVNGSKWMFKPNQEYLLRDPNSASDDPYPAYIGYLRTDKNGVLTFKLTQAMKHPAPGLENEAETLPVNFEIDAINDVGRESKVKVQVIVVDDTPQLQVTNVANNVIIGMEETIIGTAGKFTFGADNGDGRALWIQLDGEATARKATYTSAGAKKGWVWQGAKGTIFIDEASGTMTYKADSLHAVENVKLDIWLQDADGDLTAKQQVEFTYKPQVAPGDLKEALSLATNEANLTGGTAGEIGTDLVTYKDNYVTDKYETKWYFIEKEYTIYDPADSSRKIGMLRVDQNGKLSFELETTISHSPTEGRDVITITQDIDVHDNHNGTGTIKVTLPIADDIPLIEFDSKEQEAIGMDEFVVATSNLFTFGADNSSTTLEISGNATVYDQSKKTWTWSSDKGTVTVYDDGKVTYTSKVESNHRVQITIDLYDADGDKAQESLDFMFYKEKPTVIKPTEGGVLDVAEAGLPDGSTPNVGNSAQGNNWVKDANGTEWFFFKNQTVDITSGKDVIGKVVTDPNTGELSFILVHRVQHEAGNGNNNAAFKVNLKVHDKDNPTIEFLVEITVNVEDDIPSLSFKSTNPDFSGIAEIKIAEDLLYKFGADGSNGKDLLVNGVEGRAGDIAESVYYDLEKGTLRIHQGKDIYFAAKENTTEKGVELKFSLTDADGDEVSETITVDLIQKNIDLKATVVIDEANFPTGTNPKLEADVDNPSKLVHYTEWQAIPEGYTPTGEATVKPGVGGGLAPTISAYFKQDDSTGQWFYRFKTESPGTHRKDLGFDLIIEKYAEVAIAIKDAIGNTGNLAVQIDLLDDAPVVNMEKGPESVAHGKLAWVATVDPTKFSFGADGPPRAPGVPIKLNGIPVTLGGSEGTQEFVEPGTGNVYGVKGWQILFKPGPGQQGELPIRLTLTDRDGDEATAEIIIQIPAGRQGVEGIAAEGAGEESAVVASVAGSQEEHIANNVPAEESAEQTAQIAPVSGSSLDEGPLAVPLAEEVVSTEVGELVDFAQIAHETNSSAFAPNVIEAAGEDTLFGTEGQDIFVFSSETAGGTSWVKNFSITDGDKLDLTDLMHEPASLDDVLSKVTVILGEDHVTVKYHDELSGVEQTINTEISGLFEVNNVEYGSWAEFTEAYAQSSEQDSMLHDLAAKIIMEC